MCAREARVDTVVKQFYEFGFEDIAGKATVGRKVTDRKSLLKTSTDSVQIKQQIAADYQAIRASM